jgi:hypothetical protein
MRRGSKGLEASFDGSGVRRPLRAGIQAPEVNQQAVHVSGMQLERRHVGVPDVDTGQEGAS